VFSGHGLSSSVVWPSLSLRVGRDEWMGQWTHGCSEATAGCNRGVIEGARWRPPGQCRCCIHERWTVTVTATAAASSTLFKKLPLLCPITMRYQNLTKASPGNHSIIKIIIHFDINV
jgi:hypothetical protein